MTSLDADLRQELEGLDQAGLRRSLRPVSSPQGTLLHRDGHTLVNFSSNDYLGLASHPHVRSAALQAIQSWGAGAGASRLISGSLALFHQLEAALASWKNAEACLTFSSGYSAALGVIPALVSKNDFLILDKKVHACCVDAAHLSGATLRVYKHADLSDLESKLQWAARQIAAAAAPEHGPTPSPRRRRILLVTESVFSMDGDLAPLREIVALKNRHGAWLMLDEAHAAGFFGAHRSGLADAFELQSQIDIHFGTLGKALGAAGGFIAGSNTLIDFLINRARSFIFSTAPCPAQAAAALAALRVVQSEEGALRAAQLWSNVDRLKNGLIRAGWSPGLIQSPILPITVGAETRALHLAAHLETCGVLAPAIRFPTVPRHQARLRITANADHSLEHLQRLLDALRSFPAATEPPTTSS